MATLGAFLTSIAGPLAKRVLSSLGIGLLTLVGVQAALNALLNHAKTAWSGMAPDLAVYLAMGGFNTALSILAGAMLARLTFATLKSFKFL